MAGGNLTVAGFVLALGLTLGLVLGARVGGPGDLYDKDQPKTMAGTADIALNGPRDLGRWIWPRDMLGEPATKPPLYNWLDAIVLKCAPRWGEWAFKLPSMLASFAVAAMIIASARRLLASHENADLIALLAAAIWLASKPVMKQMYLSRPDMVMTAFLAGAWLCATRAIEPAEQKPARFAVGFWLCVAAAALSKGPAAIIPVLYVPLAAKLIHGRCRAMFRIHWFAGLSILVATVGVWGLLAYREWPGAFVDVLLAEGASRFSTGGPESIAKPIYLPAWWFLSQWAPWSLLAAVGLLLMSHDPRKWLRHALGPAIVWVALTIVAFSLAPGKRSDYLLPAYPAAAIVAAFGLIELARRLRLPVASAALAPLLMAAYLAHYELRRSPEVQTGYSRAAVRFCAAVDSIVARDDALVSLVKGYHPFMSLMRRHDGNRARESDLSPGTWVIAPRDPAWPAHVISRQLPDIVQVAPKKVVPGQVGLYRVGDPGVTAEALLPLLAEQEAWNFPPDRYRATRERN